jgi:hypothetical protein
MIKKRRLVRRITQKYEISPSAPKIKKSLTTNYLHGSGFGSFR